MKQRAALIAVVLLAALAGAANALAATPQATLSRIASAYAGKPVTIMCAANDAEWSALLLVAGVADDATGFARPEEATAWLRAYDCQQLVRLASGRAVDAVMAGDSVMILTHETTHLALDSWDEGQTECAAYRNVWRMLGLFPHRQRHALYRSAQDTHRHMPAAYRAVC
jgi:hypothetical protein